MKRRNISGVVHTSLRKAKKILNQQATMILFGGGLGVLITNKNKKKRGVRSNEIV